MAGEPLAAKKRRLRQIMARLRRAYPQAGCALRHADPLQLLIATILSAQCTDQRVNQVTTLLFRKYRTAADYAAASRAELEAIIRPTGFFRNKARSIQACCRALVERHGGQVPRTMAELIQLDGVGRKTANVVLGNAFGINEGIPVDTHVARLARRLKLSPHTHPDRIEQDLMALAPRRHWAMLSHWLIWHGRRRCAARKPDCPHCEIGPLCPSRNAAP